MFAPEIILKSSARYKRGLVLDGPGLIDWSVEKMYPILALSGRNITKVTEVAACPPEEAFPMRMHPFGLAVWHQEKSILKNAENNAKNSRKNSWNESTIHSSTVKGGKDIWHPKRTEVACKKSQGRSPIWLFCSFGLQPQMYRHLQRLHCMEMNNINRYNKTKQQTESKFKFHPLSPILFNSTWRSFKSIFKSERAWKFRTQGLLTFTQSGFEALLKIKMLPSTDWIQCVFQKVPLSQWDVCNFF